MTDKEKMQKLIIEDIHLLKTDGYEVIQGNFNLTKQPDYYRIDVKGMFKVRKADNKKDVLDVVDRDDLSRLACEFNKYA